MQADSSDDEETGSGRVPTNPLLTPTETPPPPVAHNSILHMLARFIKRDNKQQQPPPPVSIFTTLGGGSGQHDDGSPRGSRRCCCSSPRSGTLVCYLLLFVLLLAGLVAFITVNQRWATVEQYGNAMVSLTTRYAALQSRYRILAYYDVYNVNPLPEDVRTETTAAKSMARIAGSLDVASLRIDWDVHVVDAHVALGARMTVALWVQEYNTTTHLLQHIAHSPMALCANVPTTAPCAGHVDRPALDNLPARLENANDPIELSLVLLREGQALSSASDPLWTIPVVHK